MRFDIWKAITYIFDDKKLIKKFYIFCLFILLYLIIGIFRNFFISPLYFNDIADKLSLAIMNIAPYSFLQFIGAPVSTPYLISFDIGQLATAKLDLPHIKAILMVFTASLVLSPIIGYFICNTRNLILKGWDELPKLNNIREYFLTGFKFIYGIIIISLPALVLNLFVARYIYSYFSDIGGAIISMLYPLLKPIVVILATALITLVIFFYLSVCIIPYIADLKFKSLFKIKTVFQIIFGNFKTYLKYIWFYLLFTFGFALLTCASTFLHRIILEQNIIKYEIPNYIKMEDFNSLVFSLILILCILPFMFWYFAIISSIQAQFIAYLLKKKTNKEFMVNTWNVKKSTKILIISFILLFTTFFSVSFIKYYKVYNTVNSYMKKLETYGLTFNYAKNAYGTLDEWNTKSTEEVFQKISKVLPIDTICGSTDNEGVCFDKDYPKLNGKGSISITKKSFYKFKLTDGSTAAIYYNFPKCDVNDSKSGITSLNAICGSIWFDINGKKDPNVYGIDLFQLVITKDGELVPRGDSDDKVYSIERNCSNKSQSGDACGAWIFQNKNMDYLKRK